MLDWTNQQLEEIGAVITTNEIKQQPELWKETLDIFNSHKESLNTFLEGFKKETTEKIRVIFTGAGTSAYVGDVLRPHLTRYGNTSDFIFEAIPTTDIVSAPLNYFNENSPTLLVSFARSGNSPESVATIDLANQVVKNVKHLIISCAPEGKLAVNAKNDNNSFVMLMPSRSNDQGFAMTGSFSCMTLAALLTFDTVHKDHDVIVSTMVDLGNQVLTMEEQIADIIAQDFNRVVYLGSESLSGLTREAQLKLLELTAGKIATVFDSSLGFRHGPKSFVDDKTLVFGFISNDAYTSLYDVDILEEINGNDIAVETIALSQNASNYSGKCIFLANDHVLSDGFLALPLVMLAQVVALLTSVKVNNKPDTPSPTGTVNRVVQGVTIHPFN
ncbi:SIS domain-containing protein [Vagococcus sp. JNUCC 83]